MDEYLAQHASTLFSFAAENSGGDSIRRLVRNLHDASKFKKNDVPKTVGCFMLLPLLLKEDKGIFFKCYDVSIGILQQFFRTVQSLKA